MSNRKKHDTYRFNGYDIKTVEIKDLELYIKKFESKLSDPNDADDKRWTARWLDRLRKELDKKQDGYNLKQRERRE